MIGRIEPLEYSIVTDVDSYKLSHWKQYPAGTTQMFSYFESRGGAFENCTLFGLQYLVHKYLTQRVTKGQVQEAKSFADLHGEPFNEEGWMHIVNRHDGRLPVIIRAIPEGTVVPTSNVILSIESTDPEVWWLPSWIETMLVRLWYPSTVALLDRESKKTLTKYYELTSDEDIGGVDFLLHDFGGRGVTSLEQSRLGGAAHLLNFKGSDTIEGIRMANHYYHCPMAAFSIPASEHSTVTMWGREREFQMVERHIQQYLYRQLPPGVPKLAACVGDSFDIYNFTQQVTTGRLKQLIKSSGGKFIERPDSGDPLEVLPKILAIMSETIGDEIRVNSKGYRVLPPWIGLLQGDGIDRVTMEPILKKLTDLKWSTQNLAFGSGGGLLQKLNRDTQKWAFKCSAAKVNGTWVDVLKDPITDKGKRSKAGRLDLIQTPNGVKTVVLGDDQIAHPDSVMHTVFENGEILYDTTLDECRARMAL